MHTHQTFLQGLSWDQSDYFLLSIPLPTVLTCCGWCAYRQHMCTHAEMREGAGNYPFWRGHAFLLRAERERPEDWRRADVSYQGGKLTDRMWGAASGLPRAGEAGTPCIWDSSGHLRSTTPKHQRWVNWAFMGRKLFRSARLFRGLTGTGFLPFCHSALLVQSQPSPGCFGRVWGAWAWRLTRHFQGKTKAQLKAIPKTFSPSCSLVMQRSSWMTVGFLFFFPRLLTHS